MGFTFLCSRNDEEETDMVPVFVSGTKKFRQCAHLECSQLLVVDLKSCYSFNC